jgi:hypothetical protein
VQFAKRRQHSKRELQESSDLHGEANEAFERLASRELEHQHGPATLEQKLQRPHRPRPVEVFLQSVFVRETADTVSGRVLRCRQHDKNVARSAIGAVARCPAENSVPVLPQNIERDILPTSTETRGSVHLPDSTVSHTTTGPENTYTILRGAV